MQPAWKSGGSRWSNGFKEKNGWRCLAIASTSDMKNTKETVYHCYNSWEKFPQFDVSFWAFYLLVITLLPQQFLVRFRRITKFVLKYVCGGGGVVSRPIPPQALATEYM